MVRNHRQGPFHLAQSRGGVRCGAGAIPGNTAVRQQRAQGRGFRGPNAFSPLDNESPSLGDDNHVDPTANSNDLTKSGPATHESIVNQVRVANPVGENVDNLSESDTDSGESSGEDPDTPTPVKPRDAHKVFDKTPQSGRAVNIGNAVKVIDNIPVNFNTSSSTARPQCPRSWASLVKNRDISNGACLEYIPPVQGKRVRVDEELLDKVDEAWGFCLAGHFATRFPGKQALKQLCDSWQVPHKFFAHATGWIVFKFECEEHRERVLRGGPYSVFGRALMLKRMPRCFEFDKSVFRHIPVWVKMPGLPLDCWNPKVLSIIASAVGKPIVTDMMTHLKDRVSYARVLVEIDAAEELIHSVEIELPGGQLREQPIEYDFLPKFCETCQNLGHNKQHCPSKTAIVGKPSSELTGKGPKLSNARVIPTNQAGINRPTSVQAAKLPDSVPTAAFLDKGKAVAKDVTSTQIGFSGPTTEQAFGTVDSRPRAAIPGKVKTIFDKENEPAHVEQPSKTKNNRRARLPQHSALDLNPGSSQNIVQTQVNLALTEFPSLQEASRTKPPKCPSTSAYIVGGKNRLGP